MVVGAAYSQDGKGTVRGRSAPEEPQFVSLLVAPSSTQHVSK
ncbi:MAG: hypothetical protein A4E47_00360 [Methanosaeta sp. PtaU1.Bin028]|nr:MAG: hypothetical protein A4E47_00360 [Methanosaeta sp. PtaU1.Bin028]